MGSAQIMLQHNGDVQVSGWMFVPFGNSLAFGGEEKQLADFMLFGGTLDGQNALVVPYEYKTVEACQQFVKTPALSTLCEEMVANSVARQALVKQMIASGRVPPEIVDGTEVFFPDSRPSI